MRQCREQLEDRRLKVRSPSHVCRMSRVDVLLQAPASTLPCSLSSCKPCNPGTCLAACVGLLHKARSRGIVCLIQSFVLIFSVRLIMLTHVLTAVQPIRCIIAAILTVFIHCAACNHPHVLLAHGMTCRVGTPQTAPLDIAWCLVGKDVCHELVTWVQEEAEALQRELEQKEREEAERQRKLEEAAEKQRKREAELEAKAAEEKARAAAAPPARPPTEAPSARG